MTIRLHIEWILDKLFGLYYNYRTKNKTIPNAKNAVVLQSGISLSKKIHKGEIKSEDVVRAFIERITQVNPIINAVVDQRFEEAIREAQKIDAEIASGVVIKGKPLLGVPFTIKETISVKGLSNTFGLISRKSHKAKFNADVVQKLQKAGGIILGVTNVPQLSAWYETYNPIYGTTCNPYDITRTAGGSSGGEASIVAACGAPFGIGTDLGGSIRNPAFMCGLFGHKCTNGLISLHGVMFNLDEKKNSMACIGPLTKYSEDLIPILKVLVGDNINKLKLDEKVDLKTIKIYYILDTNDSLVSPIRDDMKSEMLKVVRYFSDILSQKPELLYLEDLKFGGQFWSYLIKKESNVNLIHDLSNRNSQVSASRELLKYCLGLSDFNIGVILALIAGYFPQENPVWCSITLNVLREKLIGILGTNAVLLYPSAPYTARHHYTTTIRFFNSHLFLVWNALKFCVTQVPLGLNSERLPVGIQVVGAPFQDHLTIAVARELEKAFGGYEAPFTGCDLKKV